MTSRAASVAADHEALSDGYLSDSAMEDTKDKNKKKKAWKVCVTCVLCLSHRTSLVRNNNWIEPL